MPDSRLKTADVLIGGAGIAGLLLARELTRRGQRVLLAADPARPPTSRIAAGLVNPVTGRRCSLAWNAEIALPIAREAYQKLEIVLSRPLLRQLPIVRVFFSGDDRAGWESHAEKIAAAGFATRELARPPHGLRDHGCGAVTFSGGFVIDTPALIDGLHDELRRNEALIGIACRHEALDMGHRDIIWRTEHLSVAARTVVLAGAAGDIDHPLLGPINLRPVKGELLFVHPNRALGDFAAVGSHYLAPDFSGRWICGASQVRGASDQSPTEEARAELEGALARLLEVRCTIGEHRVGVRVMSPDMRPVIGPVEADPRVHVFQALGSRGFSLAPWGARLLAEHLTTGAPLPSALATTRFTPAPDAGHRWNAVEVSHDEARPFVHAGDTAIDLTVGNGGDTYWLAERVGPQGMVIGFDIQSGALAAAQQRLNSLPVPTDVRFVHASHAAVTDFVPAAAHGRVAVALANLGYWPGSDSGIVTQPETTLPAIAATLDLLRPGGALVAVVYTGHDGGIEEREAIERWTNELPENTYAIKWRRHPGGAFRAPCVLIVRRRAEHSENCS